MDPVALFIAHNFFRFFDAAADAPSFVWKIEQVNVGDVTFGTASSLLASCACYDRDKLDEPVAHEKRTIALGKLGNYKQKIKNNIIIIIITIITTLLTAVQSELRHYQIVLLLLSLTRDRPSHVAFRPD